MLRPSIAESDKNEGGVDGTCTSADALSSSSSNSLTKKIRPLDDSVSRRICTGQIIISLAGACRELVDNALDSGATNIEISCKNNGVDELEVIDNGSGIPQEDFDSLCKPHCTSKLADFSSFNLLTTFGFRGEALNALAAISDVKIATRTSDSRCAWRLSFDRNGKIVSREQCSRTQGTTVSISTLFKTLPVRRKELQRNARREFLRLVECVQAFSLARTDCRFNCSNTISGKRSQLVCSPGGPSTTVSDVIGSLFGTNAARKELLPIEEEVELPSEEIQQMFGVQRRKNTEQIHSQIRLSGFVSSCEPGQGRWSTDRQFVFVNGRHVDFQKLCRVANDLFSLFNRGRYCTLVLFVDIPPNTLDVNVSPDKRTVFLQYEKELFAKFRASLLATFAKVQGNCAIQGQRKGTTATAGRRQMSTLLKWKETKVKLEMGQEEEEGMSDREGERERELAGGHFRLIPETQQSADISHLRETANSRLLDEDEDEQNAEEQFAFDESEPIGSGNGREDERERERDGLEEDGVVFIPHIANPVQSKGGGTAAQFQYENGQLGGEQEEEEGDSAIGMWEERIFNPNDSQNMRDSFVLADSPQIAIGSGKRRELLAGMGKRTIGSDKDGGGFVTAAAMLMEGKTKRGGGGEEDGDIGEREGEMDGRGRGGPLRERPLSFFLSQALFLPESEASLAGGGGDGQLFEGQNREGDGTMQNERTGRDDGGEDEEEEENLMNLSVSSPRRGDRRARELQQGGNRRTPKNGRIQSALKSLEAFSFECIRPGGVAAAIRDRMAQRGGGDVAEGVMQTDAPQGMSTPPKSSRSGIGVQSSPSAASGSCPSPSASSLDCRSPPRTPRPHQPIPVGMGWIRRGIGRKRRAQREAEEEMDQRRPVRIEEAQLDFTEENAEQVKREIERKLSTMLSKSDFSHMQLVGQFNSAFLLCRLGPHLFMIDQHAADEKYNFEQLQAKARVKSQKLVDPKTLQIGSLNAAILRDNRELFLANGFEFVFPDEEQSDILDELAGTTTADSDSGSILLTALPSIQGWQFDQHDIDELISLVAEMPGQMHRPKKLRAIFASRACRKSVMFGETLDEEKMRNIIVNMGTMDQPWNCPHGRPTIRHLCTVHRD